MERGEQFFNSVIEDLKTIKEYDCFSYSDYWEIGDSPCTETGPFEEYGLSFEFIEEGTFGNENPYYRYQLAWGGPEYGIEFHGTGLTGDIYNDRDNIDEVKFYFTDWFGKDYYERTVPDDIADFLIENLFI